MPCKTEWIVNWPVILGLLSARKNEELYKGAEGENAIKLAWILSLDWKKKCHRQRREFLDLKYNKSDFSEQPKEMAFTKATKPCEKCGGVFWFFFFFKRT